MDKTDIGIDEQYTCVTGKVMCNPIMQAKLLNKAKVDLNVVVGLCVGHDSLFYKYAKGITTTLVTRTECSPTTLSARCTRRGLTTRASACAGRRGARIIPEQISAA